MTEPNNTQGNAQPVMARTQNEIYRDRYAARLAAKVAAVNQANAEANRLQPIFREAFRPFVGKKILTHGGLAQKPKTLVESLLPPWKADGYKTPSTYRNSSDYSLSFTVKICVSSSESCAYHEATFYVGKLDGYNLAEIETEPTTLRTDWTAEQVREIRKDYDKAEAAQHAAQSALGPFGRYDN